MITHRESPPRIASREEWLAARTALLQKEKELTRARDAMLAERLALPMVRVEKQYRFRGPDGEVGLLDLFEGRRQLIVHHFMWLDEQDEGCPGCSSFVDSLGNLIHLHAANTTITFVSRAPIQKLQAFRERMGWDLPLYSSAGSDFNFDFQSTVDRSRGAVQHNYRDVSSMGGDWSSFEGDLPGQSVFYREGDEIFHSYSAYARGTEGSSNVLGLLDLTPLGRQEIPGTQGWLRHHDRYDGAQAPVQLARRERLAGSTG